MGLNDFNYSEEKDTLTKKYLVPKKIILAENVQNADLLLKDTPRQPTLGKTDVCTLDEGAYVVMDFGSELHGGVDITVNRIETNNGGDKRDYCNYGKIRIVFGESVSEAMSSIGDEKKAQNEHSTRDMTVETCQWSNMRYGNTGFRFVKIEAVEGNIQLVGVKGVLEYRDIEYKGTFKCNDERLNKVFDTAVYTVHLNMQNYIWDGIKRDRLVWIGDMHPEVATICSVFGYDDCVEKSLDFVRNSYPITDETAQDVWMFSPCYTCWWIIIQRDWYMQNARKDYLLSQRDYMYRVCQMIMKRIDNQGRLDFGDYYFVDWSSNDTAYAEAGFRGCLIIALEAAAQIFEIYGDETMKEECLRTAENVKKARCEFAGNKQMTAMAALSGLCDVKCAEKIITTDLLRGLSTFYGYYVLCALAKADNIQSAIDVMRGYWGGMIDCGATTFWEDFDIEWLENAGSINEPERMGKTDIHGTYGRFCYEGLRHSLCHGWASGPADFIMKNILGVQILEPGCKKVRVSPRLGDLEWVKGTYPTPYGVIEIKARSIDGRVETEINAPDGITIC